MVRVRRSLLVCGLLGLAAALLASVGSGNDEPTPGIPWAQQTSGRAFLSPAVRAQQDDLTVNPGMLWVDKGEELWRKPEGAAGRSCASCHGEPQAMQGVAARYPRWDGKAGVLRSIETRIQACRTDEQRAPALAAESEPLLALSALVQHQSHGAPLTPVIDGPARAAFEAGRRLYGERVGQLNLACAQCHDDHWGRRLRSETVSQGQANGYPLYRLEWQTLGSLHRRLRSCFLAVRAEPPAHGSADHLALELYLAWRAKGLPVETPAVRR